MRILLLGGTGFLGARTAHDLAAAGHDVTVLSRGRRAPLEGISNLIADRRDAGSMAAALEGSRFDFTVDFSAYDAADVQNLLLVPHAALGRYIMISSGQVYLVTRSTRTPYREEESERPLMSEPPPGTTDHAQWSYGVAKRRAEGTLLSLRDSHGVRAVVLRLPVVLGENDVTLRLWAYLERMLDGAPLILPNGGRQDTRFIYAGDVVRVVQELMNCGLPRESVYNLAQPETFALREVLERLARSAGATPRFVDATWDEIERAGIDRSFSPYAGAWVSVLDPSRAAEEWGFLGTRLEDYVDAVVRWHLEHRPGESHRGYAQREREIALVAAIELTLRALNR